MNNLNGIHDTFPADGNTENLKKKKKNLKRYLNCYHKNQN